MPDKRYTPPPAGDHESANSEATERRRQVTHEAAVAAERATEGLAGTEDTLRQVRDREYAKAIPSEYAFADRLRDQRYADARQQARQDGTDDHVEALYAAASALPPGAAREAVRAPLRGLQDTRAEANMGEFRLEAAKKATAAHEFVKKAQRALQIAQATTDRDVADLFPDPADSVTLRRMEMVLDRTPDHELPARPWPSWPSMAPSIRS